MNVAEYGGGLQRIGLENLMKLADIENRRYWNNVAENQASEDGQSAVIGGLVGTVGGMGKGLYEGRKAKHDAENAQKKEDWKNEVFNQKLKNMRDGKAIDADLKPEPTLTDYSAWDDLMKGLRDQGWVD